MIDRSGVERQKNRPTFTSAGQRESNITQSEGKKFITELDNDESKTIKMHSSSILLLLTKSSLSHHCQKCIIMIKRHFVLFACWSKITIFFNYFFFISM